MRMRAGVGACVCERATETVCLLLGFFLQTCINQFKSLLGKDPNLLVHFLFFIMMSNAIGKLKHA